jgi:glutamate/aspartate transport system substrate-binding protein
MRIDRVMRCTSLALVAVALTASAALAQSVEGRLKTIRETATLRIAYRTDSRPFSYLDAQGRPTGYTIDLCERVARSLQRELDIPTLTIKWVPVDTRTRFESIGDGTADMECGSTTVSLTRMKIVDFSTVVFVDTTGVLVKADSGLNGFDAMAGRRIGIITGSTNGRAVREQLQRRKLEAALVEFRDRQDAFAALTLGAIDGFATDKLVLTAMAQASNARDFSLLPDDLSFEPFAIMLPRGDWAFRLAVNTGLAQVFRSGDVIEIYSKYFNNVAWRPSVWLGAVFAFGGLPE